MSDSEQIRAAREAAPSSEVPEADALEQRLEVEIDEEEVLAPSHEPEVPEADALEQARTVPVDDEYEG